MSRRDDCVYFERRAETERELASKARTQSERAHHARFAQCYGEIAAEIRREIDARSHIASGDGQATEVGVSPPAHRESPSSNVLVKRVSRTG
jgi:hypothetical protein